MEQLAPLICELLDMGKKVIVPARGNSMIPLVRNQKDSIVLKAFDGKDLGVGDAVFYKRTSGQYVLHRIVEVADDGSFTIMGDGLLVCESGIRKENIIAVPFAFIRKNRYIYCASRAYKKYAEFWAGSVFWRKLNIKLWNLKIKISSKLR